MHRGYFKWWRKSLDSPIWGDANAWMVWDWCLARANYEPTEVHGRKLEVGQFVTGRSAGSRECKLNPSTWRHAMERLEKAGMITTTKDRLGTVVTIVAWHTYNGEDDPRGQGEARLRPGLGQGEATRKGHRETFNHPSIKASKKETPLSPFEEFWQCVPNKTGKQAARKAWEKAVDRVTVELECSRTTAAGGILIAMRAFSQTPKARGNFCPHPTTWLNEGRYDDDPATWQDDGEPSTRSSRNMATAQKLLREDADESQRSDDGSLGAALRELQSGGDPRTAGDVRLGVGGNQPGQDSSGSEAVDSAG